MKQKRFDAVLNIPSPYRIHLLGELSRQLDKLGWVFYANFMAKWHAERPMSWRNPTIHFGYKYWRDFGVGCHHFNPGLIFRRVLYKSDVLLLGSPFDTFTGIFCALFARAEVKICWVEGNTKTPGKLNGFLGWFKRIILSRFDYAAVPGKEGAEYVGLHAARTRMKMPVPVCLPNLIDETRFRPRSQWSPQIIARCREKMGAGANDKICIIPARLTTVKGLIPFLQALRPEFLENWKVVIVGQGELKDAFLDKANEVGIAKNVRIFDYVSYEDMPKYYAASDLFLLPSIQDMNPLVVPEALHSGLPVALSDCVGNVSEGVTDGVNGWRLPVLDGEKYTQILKDVFTSDIGKLRRFGGMSYSCNARFWDSAESVEKFLSHIGVSYSMCK